MIMIPSFICFLAGITITAKVFNGSLWTYVGRASPKEEMDNFRKIDVLGTNQSERF